MLTNRQFRKRAQIPPVRLGWIGARQDRLALPLSSISLITVGIALRVAKVHGRLSGQVNDAGAPEGETGGGLSPQRIRVCVVSVWVMQFCDSCGSAMVKVEGEWVCRDCEPETVETSSSSNSSESDAPSPRSAKVSSLPTTDSGAVRKSDAMEWLDSLEKPTDKELKRAVVPKPSGFTGSTFPTSISNVRVTGDPEFVEAVAGLFKVYQEFESSRTRVEINLQRTEDKETGELTDNYALYLSVAERA